MSYVCVSDWATAVFYGQNTDSLINMTYFVIYLLHRPRGSVLPTVVRFFFHCDVKILVSGWLSTTVVVKPSWREAPFFWCNSTPRLDPFRTEFPFRVQITTGAIYRMYIYIYYIYILTELSSERECSPQKRVHLEGNHEIDQGRIPTYSCSVL